MRIIYIITAVLALHSSIMATELSTNGTLADVQSKVNGAARGDTVLVHGGSYNWGSGTLVLTQGVYLKGDGYGSVTITGNPTASVSGMISVVPDATPEPKPHPTKKKKKQKILRP